MTNEEWQRKRDWLREDMTRYRKDHPEVVEAERLTRENARLEYELTQAKAREAEHLRGSKSNQHRAIGLSVYLGGAFLVWLFFRGACPGCITAGWWDLLSVPAYAGWSIGGIFAGNAIADRLCFRRGQGDGGG